MSHSTPPQLKQPKTAIIADGRRKVHSSFTDGSEVVEEFDVVTDELLLRKSRRPTPVGGEGKWIVEVGLDENALRGFNPDLDLLRESSTAPVLIRKDNDEAIAFRIRNLPYPKEVFAVSVDDSTNTIVVRTSNKKYFKRIELPDFVRMGVKLDPSNLSWDVALNTLVITYKKHLAVRVVEAQEKKERASTAAVRLKEDGEPQCPQQ